MKILAKTGAKGEPTLGEWLLYQFDYKTYF